MFGNSVTVSGNTAITTALSACFKAAFRQACVSRCQVGLTWNDQSPESFVSKEIKPGIARSFVENIHDWVEKVKSVAPIN